MKKRIRRALNGFTLLFLALSIFNLTTFIRERSIWNDIRFTGVRVDAVVTEAVESSPDDPNEENIHQRYTFDGKDYTYVEFLYADSRWVGRTVTIYVDPAMPQTPVVNDGGAALTYFFLMLLLTVLSAVIGYVSTPGN
ncbi:MAG: hypothetical protein IJA71_03055 [Clostridia bacterium]|nr:hypothetical protein [Clostridia bacterium]